MAKPYDRKDRFFKKAKKDGYVARSVYKLEEIDQRFALFSKGQAIVDLGCSPGSWLQFLSDKVGERGLIVGYDIAPVKFGEANVRTFVRDIYELTPDQIRADAERPELPFDALVSDLAPKTTGIRDADQAKQIGLVEHALALATVLLSRDGVFAAKVFQGRGFDQLIHEVRGAFKDVRALRPKATRQGSREAFLIARTLRDR